LVGEVSEALREKVNGAMTLDDRQAYNLAREIVEPFGYAVLHAVREWEKSKAPYREKKTADVIAELIEAASRNLRAALVKLNSSATAMKYRRWRSSIRPKVNALIANSYGPSSGERRRFPEERRHPIFWA